MAHQPSWAARGLAEALELDIAHLSQQWEARRTIRGDTPAGCAAAPPRCKAGTPARIPLAALPANVAAANPFSLSAQRLKGGASGQPCQQQQASVRFAVEEQCAATPAAVPPSAGWQCGTGGASTAGAGSPSPYVLFRGRLSFAAEVESARKFDRPGASARAAAANERGGKRKLLISPDADISSAFPSLLKPAAKLRRRSLSDVCADWAGRWGAAADAGADDVAAAAADEDGAAGGSGDGFYWSDPLPLPPAAWGPALDDDMQDTAASPASCSGHGDSPACGGSQGMDACSSPVAPAFSPLPCALQPSVLPTVDHPDCGFPSITPKTMRDLLTHGAGAFGLTSFVVVDCRYDYEHTGGHLPGAVHLTTPDALRAFLAGRSPQEWATTALIFHCEFSTERGPRAAKHVRNEDRVANMHDYPALTHPHVFVLQGGYKAFWRAHGELCEGGYTPMDHPAFSAQLKACHAVVRKAWARTTRTFGAQQRKRRPSYCLRQSTGGGGGRTSSRGAGEEAAAAEAEQAAAPPPAFGAARHAMRAF